MNKNPVPHGLPNTLSQFAERGGKSSTTPDAGGTALGVNFSEGLTRSERLALEQRLEVLKRYDAGVKAGLTQQRAAKEAGASVVTIWRWKNRNLTPRFSQSGRRKMEMLNPPTQVLRRVCELQLAGKSNAAAWKLVSEEILCPPRLAAYIRSHKTVAASLLKATRLTRTTARVIKGPHFTIIKE